MTCQHILDHVVLLLGQSSPLVPVINPIDEMIARYTHRILYHRHVIDLLNFWKIRARFVNIVLSIFLVNCLPTSASPRTSIFREARIR